MNRLRFDRRNVRLGAGRQGRPNLTPRVIDGWGYAWAVRMFGLGLTNIAVVLTFGPAMWGTFGAMGAE